MLVPLLLAQTLVSYAPSVENLSVLSAVRSVPAAPVLFLSDTVPPPQAVSLSDGYYTRLDIHRYASYATLPLFLIEYLAGQKLLQEGSDAPLWADAVHKPAAYALAGVFTVNTVTGLWNLAEAGGVKQGKTRRWVHAILMLTADAGFIYGATLAPSTDEIDDRIAAGERGGWTPHKRVTVASMGVALAGLAMMYIWD